MSGHAPAFLRAVAWSCALLLAGTAWAQTWTVQTVALRDYQEARAVAADLERMEFDAYTEFAMNEGRQYTRVRVGCYHARRDAEALAELLRTRATDEAVAVSRTPGAPAAGCVRRNVGFRAPESYHQPIPGSATFVVDVGDMRGMIRFRDGRWELLQEPAAQALAPTRPGASTRFAQVADADPAFVRVREERDTWIVCPGRMLAQVARAAIVEQGGVVVACIWTPGSAPQGAR
ncbi:MAG: SPOR domain-containing protein [Trueperaceae bacterium]|nr:SPOR domain-containing protein [Trueperaceae bacterium]